MWDYQVTGHLVLLFKCVLFVKSESLLFLLFNISKILFADRNLNVDIANIVVDCGLSTSHIAIIFDVSVASINIHWSIKLHCSIFLDLVKYL